LSGQWGRFTNQNQQLEFDLILYVTDRTPNIAGLGLKTLGVKLDATSAIKINDELVNKCCPLSPKTLGISLEVKGNNTVRLRFFTIKNKYTGSAFYDKALVSTVHDFGKRFLIMVTYVLK
jgi:hypothetical protein